MNWLNYHHLQYFWKVAKEGSVARASTELRLAPPTISAQIHLLEDMLGHKLLQREGRGLVLTPAGREVYHFADRIFATGEALVTAMGCGGQKREQPRLVVGVGGTMPGAVVQRLLAPVFAIEPSVLVSCRQHLAPEAFAGELAAGRLDVVLSDALPPASVQAPLFSHAFDDCGTSFFAEPTLADALRPGFPRTLHGAPCICPSGHTRLRHGFDAWCDSQNIVPYIVAEVDDPGLASVLAQSGLGVLVAADQTDAAPADEGPLWLVGHAPELRHTYFAWSHKQQVVHPGVLALCQASATGLGQGAHFPRFV